MAKGKKVKLKAPKGTDEANAGGESFRVDNDGTIEVPEDAVGPLLEHGGFTEVKEAAVIPHGHALVMHDDPKAATSAGEKFGDGFLVPAHKVADLASHGFRAVEHVTETVDQAVAHVEKDELKQDGPTVEQWVAEGYLAINYPPEGYAPKSTQEEIDAAIAAQAKTEKPLS